MILLALDVSSTATGFAVFHGRHLHHLGVVRPAAGHAYSHERVDDMADRVIALGAIYSPHRVVMEFSSGQVGSRLRRAGVSPRGLAVLGQAQGAVRQGYRAAGLDPACYPERWTGGVPKQKRADRIALEFPAYAAFRLRDKRERKGMDAADAVGLAIYYLARLRTEELLATAKGGR